MEITDNIACKFWSTHFDRTKEVATPYFLQIFSSFIQEYAKIALDEQQLAYISSLIDPMKQGIITFIEFAIFYERFWKIPSNRLKLFKYQFKTIEAAQLVKQEYELQNLIIRFIKLPENCHNYLKPPNSLKITSKSIILSGENSKKKNLQQENFITIGNSKNNDIEINDCENMNSNAFQIVILRDSYLIKDLGLSQRSKMLVCNKPVILDKDMVITMGLCSLKVIEISPDSVYKRNLTPCKFKTKFVNIDHNLAYFNQICQETQFKSVENYVRWNQEKEVASMKYNILKPRKLALECIKGKNKGKEYYFSVNSELKYEEFGIGRGKLNQGRLEDMSVRLQQCKLVFNLELGWYLISEQEEFEDFATWVEIASVEEIGQRRESNLQIIWDKSIIQLEDDVVMECVPTMKKILREEEK